MTVVPSSRAQVVQLRNDGTHTTAELADLFQHRSTAAGMALVTSANLRRRQLGVDNAARSSCA